MCELNIASGNGQVDCDKDRWDVAHAVLDTVVQDTGQFLHLFTDYGIHSVTLALSHNTPKIFQGRMLCKMSVANSTVLARATC